MANVRHRGKHRADEILHRCLLQDECLDMYIILSTHVSKNHFPRSVCVEKIVHYRLSVVIMEDPGQK